MGGSTTQKSTSPNEAVARSSAKVLPKNSVLVAMYGATVGQLGILRRPMTCNQACSALVVDPAEADYRYLFFQLLHARSRLKSLATGAAQQNLSGVLIKSLRFPFPPLSEQRAIAHILGTLDDKIELNRRMNEILEAIARALFKSWFIDFDPVRAKSEGRDSGLPEHLAHLFPDSFEDSELGEVPEGWGVVPLDHIASIQGGKQLPTEDCLLKGPYPVYGANGLMGFAHRATHDGFVIAFGRVGAYCGSIHWVYGGAWINNNASSVVPRSWPEYVLQAMLAMDFEPMRTGSAQPFIANRSLAGLRVLRPTGGVLDAYCREVHRLRLRQVHSWDNSGVLTAARDTLLPQLISGGLRVKDAERIAAGTNA